MSERGPTRGGSRWRLARTLVALAATAALTGCRVNPECFGVNECGDPSMICLEGRCRSSEEVFGSRDAGPRRDAGVITHSWEEDVRPIVERRCQECHGRPQRFFAPMPLVAYEDTRAASPKDGRPFYVLMAERIRDVQRPMPQPGSASGPLTPAEAEAIVAWVSQGGPRTRPLPDAGVRADAEIDAGSDDGGADGGVLGLDGSVVDAGRRNPLLGLGTVTFVAGGFGDTDGAEWFPRLETFVFTDAPNGRIFSWTAASGVTEISSASGGASGLRADLEGNLIVCERETRSLAILEVGGRRRPLVGSYLGQRLNGPDNVVVRRTDGMTYFTDPGIGLADNDDPMRYLEWNGVFQLSRDGMMASWYRGALDKLPTGIALSPDQQTLYVSLQGDDEVLAFTVAADGRLLNLRRFSITPRPDGLAVDMEGNVYVAAAGAIMAYAADGTPWGSIPILSVPGTQPTSLAFGDPDRRTLLITAGPAIYRLRVAVPGF